MLVYMTFVSYALRWCIMFYAVHKPWNGDGQCGLRLWKSNYTDGPGWTMKVIFSITEDLSLLLSMDYDSVWVWAVSSNTVTVWENFKFMHGGLSSRVVVIVTLISDNWIMDFVAYDYMMCVVFLLWQVCLPFHLLTLYFFFF